MTWREIHAERFQIIITVSIELEVVSLPFCLRQKQATDLSLTEVSHVNASTEHADETIVLFTSGPHDL